MFYNSRPITSILLNLFFPSTSFSWSALLAHVTLRWIYFYLGLSSRPNFIILSIFLVYSIGPISLLLYFGSLYRPSIYSDQYISWATRLDQLYTPYIYKLGHSTIHVIFLFYFFSWVTIADQYSIYSIIFLGYYTDPVLLFCNL